MDIVAKFFLINIVKKKYNFFRFVQIYEFGVLGFYVLKKLFLKLLYKLHFNRKWISFSTLFDEQNWHVLRFEKRIFRNFRMISQLVFDNKISIFLKHPTYCSFILQLILLWAPGLTQLAGNERDTEIGKLEKLSKDMFVREEEDSLTPWKNATKWRAWICMFSSSLCSDTQVGE